MEYKLVYANCGGIMKKILYIMIGCISLGLGIIGVILPIFPTVPFVLLAAFCFARSSERLDGWFKNTKLYRENNIKNGMTKQAKIRIMCSVTILMSIGFIMMGLKGIVIGNIVLRPFPAAPRATPDFS